jgi:hypothetical protein
MTLQGFESKVRKQSSEVKHVKKLLNWDHLSRKNFSEARQFLILITSANWEAEIKRLEV